MHRLNIMLGCFPFLLGGALSRGISTARLLSFFVSWWIIIVCVFVNEIVVVVSMFVVVPLFLSLTDM